MMKLACIPLLGSFLCGASWFFVGVGQSFVANTSANFRADNYAIVADANALDFTTSMTVMGWVKGAGSGGEQVFASKSDYGAAKRSWFAEKSSDNQAKIKFVWSDNGSSATALNSAGTFFDSTWHFFAITFGNADGSYKVKIYRDGLLDASAAAGITTLATNDVNVLIGGIYNSGTVMLLYNGLLAQPSLFNIELSASQISTFASAPSDISASAGLVLWHEYSTALVPPDSTSTIYNRQNTAVLSGVATNWIGADFSTDHP